AKCQPEAGEYEPDDITNETERAGADIFLPIEKLSADGLLAERPEREECDVETGPRPGDADDYDRHDNRGDQPSKGHEQATEEDPEEIEDERHRLAVTSPCWRRPSPVRSDRRLYGFRCWL